MAKIIINIDKCTGCNTCQSICPADCYSPAVNGKIVVQNEGACIACRSCESNCPANCITIED